MVNPFDKTTKSFAVSNFIILKLKMEEPATWIVAISLFLDPEP